MEIIFQTSEFKYSKKKRKTFPLFTEKIIKYEKKNY